MQQQLLAAFTSLTEIILTALPKATTGQNDDPQQTHAGGNNGQTTPPQIPLSAPHHLRPVLVSACGRNCRKPYWDPMGKKLQEKLGTIFTLLESAYNIHHVVNPARKDTWKGKATCATFAIAEASRTQQLAGGRKRRERKPGPAPDYPCSMDEVRALVTAWITDGEMELPQ
ncbi:hypothetical protein RHMOL_Rhmol10G0147200 [Rhododendron molle]|uniref:Uncharacterized protein n=1 Tax=Rhododendron molle TaxID=49168 RepID=A0ACC0M408_RHOML|nr:hypothetical protein RHMOL_Rhmol10G0147200 [Rhododendron molle]